MAIAYEEDLSVTETGIPGLKVLNLSVHGDNRGWFKENYQRAKMRALGLPDLHIVQNNISFNAQRGVTRGIHAEPWDKFISIATGSVFGAWVDLRPGATFGKVFTCVLDPSKAIFVPRGVGNSFQALEDQTAYTYLVNAHWSLELKKTYTFVNLADPQLAIDWPIPLEECEVSEADRSHPYLSDAVPMTPRRTLVTGCYGQLGRAVRARAEEQGIAAYFDFVDLDTFDIADPVRYETIDWSAYGAVINCGAYTAVDAAETPEGRSTAWAANAQGPALLARVCAEHDLALVHVSSDYVFDGVQETHTEDERFAPLSVYGQTKAAGDLAVANCPKHYLLRTSWVVGDGNNFVKTMFGLANRVADPIDTLSEVTVVDDQFGRPTYTKDLAASIFWLLGYRANDVEPSHPQPFGTYNVSSEGPVESWCQIAQRIFALAHDNAQAVIPVTTAEYNARATKPVAPRPRHSAFDLSKIKATGFTPQPWDESLKAHVAALCNE